MRLIKSVFAFSLALTIFSPLASATSQSFSCSSNLVVSIDNGYSASCDGDLSFTDGVLKNIRSISLSAGGFLNIGANASLYAPVINLYSPNIHINTGAIFDTAYFNASLISLDAGKRGLVVSDTPRLITVTEAGASVDLGSNTQPSGTLSNIENNAGGTLVIRSPAVEITNSVLNPNPTLTIVSSVPEPSIYALMVLGLAAIGLRRKPGLQF